MGYAAQILHGYLNGKDNEDTARPDVHLYILSKYEQDEEGNGRDDFYFLVELLKLTSVGSLKLASGNPEEKPVIDPNMLGNEIDLEILTDAIEIMMDVFLNSSTFQRLGVKPYEPYEDLCTEHPFASRDFWKCYIRERSQPYNHPTSTCRMGPNETVAVVDSKLKVFGTENLRVMDASVIPFCPSGNTNLPAMLIGARGAELILSGQ